MALFRDKKRLPRAGVLFSLQTRVELMDSSLSIANFWHFPRRLPTPACARIYERVLCKSDEQTPFPVHLARTNFAQFFESHQFLENIGSGKAHGSHTCHLVTNAGPRHATQYAY